MELQSKRQKIDYLFGYVTRMADELGIYDEVYKWACKVHSIEVWKSKVDELEHALTEQGREDVLNY